MKSLVLKIASIPWLQHLVFWVLSIAFITSYFAISSEYSSTDLIYSLCFHLCLIPMVYIQLRLVIPNLFQKERYLFFFISSIMVVLFGWIIHFITFEYLVPNLLKSFYIVSFTENTILFGILTIYLILATLLHFSKSWFRVNALEKDKINMELNALKNQLNPHFLFNGLNGIYSLSLKNDPKASEAILKLSDLLRYSLYEVSIESVSLEKELQMIRNYIDLQLIRFKPNRDVQFNVQGTDSPFIIPMILLPLVENAFKHGNLTKDKSFIHISCRYSENHIEFNCQNSFIRKEKESGIGLKSISKLIQLYYADKASLEIIQNDHKFETKLLIQLV
ncbi:MAG: hypothetical protein CMB80_30235 [Flammeovirgaceae bacterium]|nr:hypothetical protein [Flammeovirgaceae bacterium]MBE63754.1 hypothetical protein [Flammeovirgaceae bacterium]MBR06358.1 hypothetical protein [Rickettsiales bacterium]HCX23869.1 hypothetical protein [Cytophagales bacterium]